MRLPKSLVATIAFVHTVHTSVVPNIKSTYRGGILPRQAPEQDDIEAPAPASAGAMAGMQMQTSNPKQRMESYNFVKQTTADATADGQRGVLLEPDLIPGRPGKDGARIIKRMACLTRQRARSNCVRTCGTVCSCAC